MDESKSSVSLDSKLTFPDKFDMDLLEEGVKLDEFHSHDENSSDDRSQSARIQPGENVASCAIQTRSALQKSLQRPVTA